MTGSRSDGPVVRGYWHEATSTSALPQAGTVVHLRTRLPVGTLLFGAVVLALLLGYGIQTGLFSHPSQAALVPAAMGIFFALLIGANARREYRRTERYFTEALALRKLAA